MNGEKAKICTTRQSSELTEVWSPLYSKASLGILWSEHIETCIWNRKPSLDRRSTTRVSWTNLGQSRSIPMAWCTSKWDLFHSLQLLWQLQPAKKRAIETESTAVALFESERAMLVCPSAVEVGCSCWSDHMSDTTHDRTWRWGNWKRWRQPTEF